MAAAPMPHHSLAVSSILPAHGPAEFDPSFRDQHQAVTRSVPASIWATTPPPLPSLLWSLLVSYLSVSLIAPLGVASTLPLGQGFLTQGLKSNDTLNVCCSILLQGMLFYPLSFNTIKRVTIQSDSQLRDLFFQNQDCIENFSWVFFLLQE